MADQAYVGRLVKVSWKGTNIGGLQSKTVKFNGAPIDISNDDGNGWRQYLKDNDLRSVDISLSGVLVDTTLRAAWFSGDTENQAVISFAEGDSLSGTFELTGYSEKAGFKDGNTVDLTLMSSGVVTYAPAS